jgi:hypothetical protein
VIERLIISSIRRIANEFEELQSIPYVFGVVDGSQISIIASPIDPTFYYCQKGFYSTLL